MLCLGSPSFACRLRIAFEIKGMPYELASVHLAQARQKEGWYTQCLNPMEQVGLPYIVIINIKGDLLTLPPSGPLPCLPGRPKDHPIHGHSGVARGSIPNTPAPPGGWVMYHILTLINHIFTTL